MSKQREHRRAKKAEKTKKKRSKAQGSRGSRRVVGMSADAIRRASRWPVWECWISQNWRDVDGPVHACFSRQHDDGRVAASFFEVDLLTRGVVEARGKAGVEPVQVHQELARRSTEEAPMMSVDPALVVKLVSTAADYGRKQGHEQPSNLSHASGLFGDIRGSRCREDIPVGGPDAAPVAASSGEGWFASVKRSLGFGS